MRTVRSSSRLLGGVCLSGCWDTPPGPGPGHPPAGPGHHPGLGLTPPEDLGMDTSLGRHPPGPGSGHPPLLTHACENITFPQLRLRTVIKYQNLSHLSESQTTIPGGTSYTSPVLHTASQ